ncbi:MAG: cation:proton antiporter, partial [Anaerolineales bacterium]|nr:cation:proton antiporter [Anaerolineales bacterium]
VAITIGATVFTDIASLLVLAVVAGSSSGSSGVGFLLQISALSVIYAVVILFGVPRLGRLFFRRFEGNIVEFQFVLAVLFVAAVAAEAIGMHPIVGAFLAGLAINETLSKNARVVGHLHFVGTSFFVPLFLVTIGMRIDPFAVLADRTTWMLGLGLAAAAYTTKLAAAWVTGRIYGYSRAEWMVMWGLSQAQAAATLATILVGTNAGVLPNYVLDAGILMILLTSVTSPYLVDRFGSKLKVDTPEEQKEPTFERIMVPLVHEEPPTELIKLAAALVKAADGSLLLVNLAENESDLEARQPVADLAALEETNVEVESLRRIAEPLEEGLMHELTESNVSLLLLPWDPDERTGSDVFDPLVSAVIWETTVPVMAVKLATPLNAVERLVVALGSVTVGVKLDEKSVDVAKDIARTLELPLLVLASRSYQDHVERMKSGWSDDLQVETELLKGDVQDEILAALASGDLVILPSMGSEARFRDARNHVPGYLLENYDGSIAVMHVP